MERHSVLLFTVTIAIAVILGAGTSRAATNNVPDLTRLGRTIECSPNSDETYDRTKILELFADLLYEALPDDAKPYGKHTVKNGRPSGFSVWDITDPTNLDVAFLGKCVDFRDGHI